MRGGEAGLATGGIPKSPVFGPKNPGPGLGGGNPSPKLLKGNIPGAGGGAVGPAAVGKPSMPGHGLVGG